MALTKIDDRGLKTPIDLLDNEKIRLGTGNDLEIYHDGSNSYLKNTNGALLIRGAGGSDHLHLEPKDNENGIIVKPDSGVDLYYDNSKKAETSADGLNITGMLSSTGNIQIPNDTSKLRLGASQDLQIYFNGTNSYINHTPTSGQLQIRTDDLRISSYDGDEAMIKSYKDGATYIYYDGSKKLETTSTGVEITGGLKTNGYDGHIAEFNHDLGIGARNLQIWAYADASPWGSFVGTNLTYDGTNFIKPSDNASENWGNVAGIFFEGVNGVNPNGGNTPCIRFLSDLPGNNGTNYSLGSSKTTAIDNKTVGYFTGSGDFGISDGNLVVASGHGIDFSADGHASGVDDETLSDYEEGDWTPTPAITHQGGSASLSSISGQYGRYVKIGRKVTVWFRFQFTASNISGSNVGVNGLPFSISNDGQWNNEFHGGIARRGITGGEVYICEGLYKNTANIQVLRRYNNTGMSNGEQSIGGTACYLVD